MILRLLPLFSDQSRWFKSEHPRIYMSESGRVHIETDHTRTSLSSEEFLTLVRALVKSKGKSGNNGYWNPQASISNSFSLRSGS